MDTCSINPHMMCSCVWLLLHKLSQVRGSIYIMCSVSVLVTVESLKKRRQKFSRPSATLCRHFVLGLCFPQSFSLLAKQWIYTWRRKGLLCLTFDSIIYGVSGCRLCLTYRRVAGCGWIWMALYHTCLAILNQVTYHPVTALGHL